MPRPGIKVVTNAGGLNPAGCADKVRDIADRLGLAVNVAHVEGDDLLDRIDGLRPQLANLDTGAPLTADPVTANAYLGGWGIAQALADGADVVVARGSPTPPSSSARRRGGAAGRRPTGTAWPAPSSAGHVIECGAQTTGGNYAFFDELGDRGRAARLPDRRGRPRRLVRHHQAPRHRRPRHRRHRHRPAAVRDPGPVVRQPRRRSPASTPSGSTEDGADRVRISGVRGEPAPPTAKVAINYEGGFRNTMTFVLTGLDQEAKAAWTEQALVAAMGGADRVATRDHDGDAVRAGPDATAPTRSARAGCCT